MKRLPTVFVEVGAWARQGVPSVQRRLGGFFEGVLGGMGSSASFCRQESASISRTWQCWTKRSTRAATQAAPGKIVPHCLKAKLVVITVEHFSWRRLTML